jgi:hypothetical protein
VRNLGGLNSHKKSVAGFRELPTGIAPQDISSAKNIEIGCESCQALHPSRPLWTAQEGDISIQVGHGGATVRLARQDL